MRRTCMIGSAVLVVACGSQPTTPHKPLGNANVSTSVRIAVASYDTLSVVDVARAGSKVVRKAKLAARIDTLEWLGDDPIVLLQVGSRDNCGLPEEAYADHAAYEAANRDCAAEARHDGTIGRLTAAGFVPYAALPPATWNVLQQPKDADACTTGCWSLDVVGVQVWQGHCKWVFSADGTDHCHEWAYARLDAPGPATTRYPASAHRDAPSLPTIAAPAGISVDFESATPPPHYDGDEPEAQSQLTCTLGDAAPTPYPVDPKDLDAGMSHEITWLAADPPIFAAWHRHLGFAMTEELVVFDRCKRTGFAQLVPGGDGLVALVSSDRIEVRRGGTLVGSTDGGDIVRFAPVNAQRR
jgi:hypothetical protein